MMSQWIAVGFVIAGAIFLLIYRMRYRGKLPTIRTYPVFDSLSDEVGRVAEEGAAIHLALGKGSVLGDEAMTSIAALQSVRAMLDLAAVYDTPPIITTCDPTLYILAGDWLRRAYARLDSETMYRPVCVQFTAASPILYAAMSSLHFYNSAIGSNVMLGAFNQEASLLSDAAVRKGVFSMGSTTNLEGLGALYPVLGQNDLAIGEELFAGAAVVDPKPIYAASLWAQGMLRWLVILGIVGAAVASWFNWGGL